MSGKAMNMKHISLLLASIAFSFSSSGLYANDISLGLGVKLYSTNWTGENETSGTDFERRSGQAGFNLVYQRNRFFMGANLHSGNFLFKDGSPDQVSKDDITTAGSNEEKVKHSEVDLIFGYYLLKNFSLFADVKVISNEWVDQDPVYKMESSGLGIGASGYVPIGTRFIFYGSAGFVPLKVNTEDTEIGKGLATALELGGAVNLSARNRVSFGIKAQRQTYEFDNGDDQTHRLNSVFIGYNHSLWIR